VKIVKSKFYKNSSGGKGSDVFG